MPFPMNRNIIDEDLLARNKGYRNFTSFISINYYVRKFSLKECGNLIGVSAFKIKAAMLERGFELRKPGPLPGTAPKISREINLSEVIKRRTIFKDPAYAFGVLYEQYLLTISEIATVLKISPTLVRKCLKKYGIAARKTGGKIC